MQSSGLVKGISRHSHAHLCAHLHACVTVCACVSSIRPFTQGPLWEQMPGVGGEEEEGEACI